MSALESQLADYLRIGGLYLSQVGLADVSGVSHREQAISGILR